MIAALHGTLAAKMPPRLVVHTALGIDFELWAPISTCSELPPVGEAVRLSTLMLVRNEEVTLYGFRSDGEREFFRALIEIPGIGPRIALALLSHLSPTELAHAIHGDDAKRLTRIPGIGARLAARLIVEMKPRLKRLASNPIHPAPGVVSDAESPGPVAADLSAALIALGYPEAQAERIARQLPPELDLQAAIKWALRQLAPA